MMTKDDMKQFVKLDLLDQVYIPEWGKYISIDNDGIGYLFEIEPVYIYGAGWQNPDPDDDLELRRALVDLDLTYMAYHDNETEHASKLMWRMEEIYETA
jgi:hypothetical protein